MILAGDVGGTKTNVGLFRVEEGIPRIVRRATYSSTEHTGLLPIVLDFLGGMKVESACFGIAGPVLANRVRTPNLAWEVDGAEVAREAGLPSLELINDLRATAEGIPALAAGDFTELNRGESAPEGTAALIAAGTGLGMSIIPAMDGRPEPRSSEGGHQTFAPRTRLDFALREFLHRRFGHVSVERVASGTGIRNIYDFLMERGDPRPDPAIAEQVRASTRPASVIGPAALAGACPLCELAIDVFLEAYGAAAGNLALVALARGGLYVGGGVAPKLLERIRSGGFLEAFLDKGRFRPLLETIPVLVIENPETAVLGAARHATKRPRRGA